MENAHLYSQKIEALLKQYPLCKHISADEIDLCPLHHIEESVDFLYNLAKIKPQLIAFKETFCLKHLQNSSMRSLLETEGTAFVDNLILGLKSIIEIVKREFEDNPQI